MKKRALVTGGAGFIGSHLSSRLLSEGWEVTICDNLSTGHISNVPAGATFIWADLSKEDAFQRLGKKPFDTVFHLASHVGQEPSFERPLADLSDNTLATLRLIQWAKEVGVGKFVFTSSVNVYGNPQTLPITEQTPVSPFSFYAVHKLAGEGYCSIFSSLGFPCTVLRLFNIYGPGQSLENIKQGMVRIYLHYIARECPVEVKGSLERIRDFVYIDDCVSAFVLAAQSKGDGKIFNVCTGKPTLVGELIQLLANKWNPGFKDEYPVKALPGTTNDQFQIWGEPHKLKAELDWRHNVSLDEGLSRMVAWAKHHQR
jgi:UDP-glucose 4-epimerase